MRPRKSQAAALALALALMSLASAARADLLTANIPAGTATFSFSGMPAGSMFSSLNGQTIYVGTLSGTMDGATFPMYCVDLAAEIRPGDTYAVDPHGDVAGLAGHDLIGRLLGLPAATDAFQGAALQLAIWDAEYLGGDALVVPDASTGASITTSLGSTADVFNKANDDLSRAKALPGGGPYAYLHVPSGGYGQSMVAPSAVPEPSSLALATIGVLVAAMRRRGLAPARRQAH